MDYEKKMTREEAIEKVRKMSLPKETVEILEALAPELRESEDEKIRKEIIDFVNHYRYNTDITTEQAEWCKKVIAYLEKQKKNVVVYDGDNYKSAKEKAWTNFSGKVSLIPEAKSIHDNGFSEGYQFGIHEEKPLKWTVHDEAVRKEAIACLEEWKRLIPYSGIEDYDNILNWLKEELSIHTEKQKEQKHPNGCFTCDEYKKGYEEGRRNGFTSGYNKAMKEVEQKEQNGEDEECTDFTIFHPLKIGKGEYECIPYSFYGSLTSFSEDKDLIDFLRTCFYTKEECEEWIKKQKEQEPVERWQYVGEVDLKENRAIEILEDYLKWVVSESEQECSYTWNELANAIRLGISAMKEKKPNIELIQKSWYMEGYHDRKFNKEPKWVIKTGEGGPRYEENPKYGQHIEEKPTEWSENDTVFLNEITDFFENKTVRLQHDLDMYVHWLKSLPERFNLQPKQEWSEEDEKMLTRIIERGQSQIQMFETGLLPEQINWLKSLKPQPKQERSKKDEMMLQDLCEELHDLKCGNYRCYVKDIYNEWIAWLKSLRPVSKESLQPHWKPSEEQMKALYSALNDAISLYSNKVSPLYEEISQKHFDALESLYNDLKKLM